jgi:hypothetical protein
MDECDTASLLHSCSLENAPQVLQQAYETSRLNSTSVQNRNINKKPD